MVAASPFGLYVLTCAAAVSVKSHCNDGLPQMNQRKLLLALFISALVGNTVLSVLGADVKYSSGGGEFRHIYSFRSAVIFWLYAGIFAIPGAIIFGALTTNIIFKLGWFNFPVMLVAGGVGGFLSLVLISGYANKSCWILAYYSFSSSVFSSTTYYLYQRFNNTKHEDS